MGGRQGCDFLESDVGVLVMGGMGPFGPSVPLCAETEGTGTQEEQGLLFTLPLGSQFPLKLVNGRDAFFRSFTRGLMRLPDLLE